MVSKATKMNCPMCGAAVRVVSTDEGTNSYEPVAEAEMERLRAGIRELTNHLQTHARRPCWCGMDFVAEAKALLEKPDATS